MNTKTLGQVAYEAYWQKYDDGWDIITDESRDVWEQMAQAVVEAHEAAMFAAAARIDTNVEFVDESTDGLEVGKVYTCKKGVGK